MMNSPVIGHSHNPPKSSAQLRRNLFGQKPKKGTRESHCERLIININSLTLSRISKYHDRSRLQYGKRTRRFVDSDILADTECCGGGVFILI